MPLGLRGNLMELCRQISLPAPVLPLTSVDKNMEIPPEEVEIQENVVHDLLEVVIFASELTTQSQSLRSCVPFKFLHI